MRYIGNKTNLLDNIESFINEMIPFHDDMVFCDLFSGTSSVARHFKKKYCIISNDILYFSYILQKASIVLNNRPDFSKLLEYLNLSSNYTEIYHYLEKSSLDTLQQSYNILDDELFIHNNYTPSGNCSRMYFKPDTGKRIDLIRIILNKWYSSNIINMDEFTYLLAVLIETVPYYSNISGVYGAYLKKWDPRTNKDFYLRDLNIFNNHKINKSYNLDGHDLICNISGDILYLDPPYNNRQYPPNYHILETIARYDYPDIHGVSGMRDYSNQISKFCRKREVKDALDDIIRNANFKYIIMSYSSDGILSIKDIEKIFKKHGISDTFHMAKPIEYRKYISKQKQSKKDLQELLFFIKKNVQNPKHKVNNSLKGTVQSTLDFTNKKGQSLKKYDNLEKNIEYLKINNFSYSTNYFLKCPFNYIGGKHKILPQLYSVFPKDVDVFVDLFGGGFNVGINSNAERIIYNDQLTPLVELMKYFRDNNSDKIISYIEETIIKYNLSKENKESYIAFRQRYNKSSTKNPLDLYILVCYSFNYQFRFNNSGEFNNPHGTNRSCFTKNMKSRLVKFIDNIHKKDISIYNNDFTKIDTNKLTNKSLVYCDPPYLITTGSYNDGNRGFKNWTKREEKELLQLLNKLNDEDIKFALSNVTIHNNKKNDLLLDWIRENNYKVYDINSNYSNSSYNKKKRNSKTREVLIINY